MAQVKESFYYSENLETSDIETETVISQRQEAIDDFINKQKCPKPNKKTVTDNDGLLYASWELTV